MAFKDKTTASAYNKNYKAIWYKKNRERLIARTAERKREIREWLWELKASLKCNRCGFSHHAALDFHHKDGEQKEDCVSVMCSYGFSKESLLKEIEKCEVLCANCHRIFHYEKQNGAMV